MGTNGTPTHNKRRSLNVDKLQEVWTTFNELMQALKALPGTQHHRTAAAFKDAARKWASEFRKVTFDEDVIPYIHCK